MYCFFVENNYLRIWIKEKETPGEVTNQVVTDYAKKVGVELQPGHMDRTHRVGKPGDKPRPIIVKFTSYAVRRQVFQSRKKCDSIFVGEDLTKVRNHLLYLARTERKAGRFTHCWTSDGWIMVPLKDNSVRAITTQAQLDNVINDELPK